MKISDKGITAINGALNWAEFATGADYTLESVEIIETKLGGEKREIGIILEIDDDREIVATGATFTAAGHAFYDACRAFEAAQKEPGDGAHLLGEH